MIYNEAQHPRGKGGKYVAKGGASSAPDMYASRQLNQFKSKTAGALKHVASKPVPTGDPLLERHQKMKAAWDTMAKSKGLDSVAHNKAAEAYWKLAVIQDDNLPNIKSDKPTSGGFHKGFYHYKLNIDKTVHVSSGYAGMGDGIGAGGKKFKTLDEAAAAVRVARVKAMDRFSRSKNPYKWSLHR